MNLCLAHLNYLCAHASELSVQHHHCMWHMLLLLSSSSMVPVGQIWQKCLGKSKGRYFNERGLKIKKKKEVKIITPDTRMGLQNGKVIQTIY